METGLDRLAAAAEVETRLRSARLGLLAHAASVTREFVHVRDILARMRITPEIVFGPEHGYAGDAQDMIGVDDAKDAYGTPVRSLYGTEFTDLSPRPDDLAKIDLLIIDLQDVGARYYTFVWSAVLAVRACARAGVGVLVLDRPNPLGCDVSSVEGKRQRPGFYSFVGLAPIPIRHALTLGEIVAWCADIERIPPEVVAVLSTRGVARVAHAPEWDRPFVMPSPNMPTYSTALVYPGGCLLEGTNLSEGRGTTRPFEIVGAPWINGVRLAKGIESLGLPGVHARPVAFEPTFHKYAGERCSGVQIHVTDARAFRPVATYAALVALAKSQRPDDLRFRTEPYEYRSDVPAFDLLTGSDEARRMIESGAPAHDVAEAVAAPASGDRECVESAVESGRRHAL